MNYILYSRSDETGCQKSNKDIAKRKAFEASEKLYNKVITDTEFLKLEPRQREIIAGAYRRRMCIKKAEFVNQPSQMINECKEYPGRYVKSSSYKFSLLLLNEGS